MSDLVPHLALRGLVDELTVRCTRHEAGCFWTGRYDARQGHLETCPAQKVDELTKQLTERDTRIAELEKKLEEFKLCQEWFASAPSVIRQRLELPDGRCSERCCGVEDGLMLSSRYGDDLDDCQSHLELQEEESDRDSEASGRSIASTIVPPTALRDLVEFSD